MPLSHNNAISVMVILQLTEVAEIENPGPSDYKPHEFFHARLACAQGKMGALLRDGSVHGTILICFIFILGQGDVTRETTKAGHHLLQNPG